MSSELSHGQLRMCPVMHVLLAKEHVSFGCLPPLCLSWERWLTHWWSRVAVYLSIFCTFWMNIWLWVTSTARASLQSSEQDIAEVRRRDPCCQLPTSFLRNVGFLHVSEFWSPPFLYLPLPRSLPAFCRSSIFTSFLSPDAGPSWDIMFALD